MSRMVRPDVRRVFNSEDSLEGCHTVWHIGVVSSFDPGETGEVIGPLRRGSQCG